MTREPSASTRFRAEINRLAEEYRPTRHPFFARLTAMPQERLTSAVLSELHLRYQAAMHATRVMVYLLSHLDSPPLRSRKLQIYIDDDGLVGGDTHHYQFSRAFTGIGAPLCLEDKQFGELDEFVGKLDPSTVGFVSLVSLLYRRSLGPWCVVEIVSDDWMRGLADGLTAHFPSIRAEPYFADCFAHAVEERHGQEAVEITSLVLDWRPELLGHIVEDARTMARALYRLWGTLDEVLDPPGVDVAR